MTRKITIEDLKTRIDVVRYPPVVDGNARIKDAADPASSVIPQSNIGSPLEELLQPTPNNGEGPSSGAFLVCEKPKENAGSKGNTREQGVANTVACCSVWC